MNINHLMSLMIMTNVAITSQPTLALSLQNPPAQGVEVRREARMDQSAKSPWPKRPSAPYQEFIYETKSVGNLVFKGISISLNGKNPLGVSRIIEEENKGQEPPFYHVYRIYEKSTHGEVLIREIWNDELPNQLQNLNCNWDEGRCGGPEFMAYNDARKEVYLTMVSDAGRIVSRALFSVSVVSTSSRFMGNFSTAGDNYEKAETSPSGKLLSFMRLSGGNVTNFLTIIDVESGKERSFPDDKEIEEFSKKFPHAALEITEYQWAKNDQIVFSQKTRIRPEENSINVVQRGQGVVPSYILKRVFDPTQSKIIKETKTQIK